MSKLRRRANSRRNTNGSSIAEFGPSLWLLLIFIFFPLLDLISMGVAYGCVMVLNNSQVHEASLVKYQDAQSSSGTVQSNIPNQWKQSGFGQYVNISGPIITNVSYRQGQSGSDGVSTNTDMLVRVTTTAICSPMLTIPLPVVQCPGLSAPMTFTVSSEHVMENPDFAQNHP